MKKLTPKALVLLVTTALLLTISVGSTVAYLVAGTDSVENTFTPGNVDTMITENVTINAKNSIVIAHNKGSNVDAYVRVALIGNWVDSHGYIIAPWNGEGVTLNDNWVENGEYYYYTKRVEAPDGKTDNLLGAPLRVDNIPHPYGAAELILAVIHQSIQADPKEAVADAWGEDVAQLFIN